MCGEFAILWLNDGLKMMKLPIFSTLAIFAALAFTATLAADKPATDSKLVYSAAKYDPQADADADLESSKKMARRDGRHILMVVGGDWCPWCRRFAKYIEDNEAVATLLASDFVIMKVNVSDETSNTGFLNPYPVIYTYPHLYFLDADGKMLHSQNTDILQSRSGYREEAVLTVINRFAPSKNDKKDQ